MIHLEHLSKAYPFGTQTLWALRNITVTIAPGTLAAVVGQSGSGKSTLLNILGGLDRPTSGQYWLGGQDVSGFDADTWAHVRNRTMGFVFQAFQLIPTLTAWDNVALPLVYRAVPLAERRARAREVLTMVGLDHRLSHHPAELSGGQQQRVAIARALVGDPQVLLADEPTGNLDTDTGTEIMRLLKHIHQTGRTVVIVTHSSEIAKECNQVISLRDGHMTDGGGSV